METFSALLVICTGNSPVTGEYPAQRPVTWSFDVFLICAWINCWVNNREAGDLRCHHAHYDVTVMCFLRYLEFSNVKNPCAVISWKHCARKSIIFCWIMYGFIDLNLHLILIQFSDVEHNMIGHITLASITGTNILVPYLKFKWMHLIWWLAFIVLI